MVCWTNRNGNFKIEFKEEEKEIIVTYCQDDKFAWMKEGK
jgi:hypothetical protein